MIDLSEKERRELEKHYVKPNMVKVLNSEPIDKYNQIAQRNLAQAWNTLNTLPANTSLPQIREAYVHLKCVQELLIGDDGLWSHNAFHSKYNEKSKLWARRVAEKVQLALEQLKYKWNDYLEREMLLHSIDEFDEGSVLAFDDTNATTTDNDNSNNNSYSNNGSGDGIPVVAVDLNEVGSLIKTEIQQHQQQEQEQENTTTLTSSSSSYISADVLEIIKILVNSNTICRYISPKAMINKYNLKIGTRQFELLRYDYSISFLPFLGGLDPRLRLTNAAQETNRCFFLHLGLAVSIHPYALQTSMRIRAKQYLLEIDKDDYRCDILESVLEPGGFVDLNALCFLWPIEFKDIRICCISGSWQRPLITVVQTEGNLSSGGGGGNGNMDVIMHCDGQHFSLLGPQDTPKLLNDIIKEANGAGLVVYVQDTQIATSVILNNNSSSSSSELFSIEKTLRQLHASHS